MIISARLTGTCNVSWLSESLSDYFSLIQINRDKLAPNSSLVFIILFIRVRGLASAVGGNADCQPGGPGFSPRPGRGLNSV